MYTLYALIDPRDNLTHYIGISKDVYGRFQQHMKLDRNHIKSAWIAELIEAGLAPVLDILAENLSCTDAKLQEQQLIYQYHREGLPLTNLDGVARKPTNRGMIGSKRRQMWANVVIDSGLNSGIRIEPLLTPEEAASHLNMSQYTIKRFMREGKIAGTKVGGKWRISQEELQRYIREQTRTTDKK